MATIIAAVGGGNWTTGATWVGGVAPTAADDAQLTAASGNVTINSGAVCRSLDCTTYVGTLTHTSGVTLTIGDATAGASNIALKLVSGMTYTLGSTSTSAISFISTSATVQTIDLDSKNVGNITFSGVGGSWQLISAMTTASAATVTLTSGAFDTNGQTCSWGNFSSSNTNTRSLSLGASSITITSTTFNLGTTTNLTFNAGTSSISHVVGNATHSGGGLTYYNMTLGGTQGTNTITGANTYNNLTLAGSNSGRVAFGNDIVVSGAFNANSTSSVLLSFALSTVRGVVRTITAASIGTVQNYNFQDITATGASAPWATTNVGDMGGNTGITFAAAVTRYWVAVTGGSWNATSSWSTSSGGASGASIPLCHDIAVFDANSITSGSRTITVNIECSPTLDFTNVLNSPTIAHTITNGIIYLKGDLIYKSGLTISGTISVVLSGRGTQQIKSDTVSLSYPLVIEAVGGSYTLQDNLTIVNTFSLNFGTFSAATFNVSTTVFSTSNTNTRTLTMGSGTWTLTSTGTIWNITTSTGLTLNANTSTISITDTSATSKTLVFGTGLTYYNVSITGSGTGAVFLMNSITLHDLTIGAPKTVSFSTPNTRTITGTLTATGSPGNVITLNSNNSGIRATISKASGNVVLDYVSIQDLLFTGGANYYAGASSTNVSNNAGIAFYAQPSGFGNLMTTLT